jgi:hypothetical protein
MMLPRACSAKTKMRLEVACRPRSYPRCLRRSAEWNNEHSPVRRSSSRE